MSFDLNEYKFVHIPKMSGKYFIERYGLDLSNGYLHPCFNKKYASPYYNWLSYKEPEEKMITMIRNPFDWLFSYYGHGKFHGWDGCNWRHNLKSFKHFITSYCDPNFNWLHNSLKKSFITPVCDDNGYIVCDYVLYYENFYGDIQLTEYRNEYDNEMIDLCNKKFEIENNLFSFDFENRILTKEKYFKTENIKYFDM